MYANRLYLEKCIITSKEIKFYACQLLTYGPEIVDDMENDMHLFFLCLQLYKP